MSILLELKTDYDRADALVCLLAERATGGNPNEDEFQELRRYFVNHADLASLLPKWFSPKRSLAQFWSFIQPKFAHYRERTEFLWTEFGPLLSRLEKSVASPADNAISAAFVSLNSEEVTRAWKKMIDRVDRDPEGAITASRNLVETVCKHILDECSISYDHDKIDLSELYRGVARELGLSPGLQSEAVFKQILGGCSGIVNGLGSMRNRLGDAHGKGRNRVRPAARHARFAANLAGSMTLFLVETFLAKRSEEN